MEAGSVTSGMPTFEALLKQFGMRGDPGKAVPRQVTMRVIGSDVGVVIVATAMGIELDRVNSEVRIALTGGMRHAVPLRYIELKGFNGKALVWNAVFHDHGEAPLKVTVKFGPTIGF